MCLQDTYCMSCQMTEQENSFRHSCMSSYYQPWSLQQRYGIRMTQIWFMEFTQMQKEETGSP